MSQYEEADRAVQSANASSLLREQLEKLDSNDLKALKDVGLIDQSALNTILSLKNGLKDTNVDYRKTEIYHQIMEAQHTENLDKAIKEDNLSVKSYAVGRVRDSNSINQAKRLWKIQDEVSVKGRTYIFKGEPDVGKTNTALFLAELWQKETGGRVITNMESCKRFKTVTNFQDWKKEFKKDDKRVLGIVEDASKHMSGYEVDRDLMEQEYRPFSINLAKHNGNMMLLAHTGMDVHPDMRRKSRLVHKTSKKSFTIYKRLKNGEGRNEIMSISGTPLTTIDYADDDITKWSWFKDGKETENEELKIKVDIKKQIGRKLKDKGSCLTTEIDYDGSKVAQAMREIAEETPTVKFLEDKSPKRIMKKQH